MKHIDILTKLPNTLSCIVLQEWLNLKCVVAVDSAYCSKLLRSNFLSILRSEEYFICEKFVFPSICEQSVLFRFGEKLRTVVLRKELTVAQCESIADHCHCLRNVQFHCAGSCVFAIRNKIHVNQSLESVTILECTCIRLLNVTVPPFTVIHPQKLFTWSISRDDLAIGQMPTAIQVVGLDFNGYPPLSPSALEIERLSPHLKCLGVANTLLNEDILHQITTCCPHIIHLDLENQRGNDGDWRLTDEGFLAVVQNLPRLQSVNIRYNIYLTDNALLHLSTHCANTLHTLHMCGELYRPMQYSHTAVEQLLLLCTQLRTFSYEDWVHPEDRFAFSCSALSNLTTLRIEGAYLIESDLATIAQHATNLTVLSTTLSEVSTVTDNGNVLEYNGLEYFVTKFPKLRELYLVDWHHDVCSTLLEPLRAARPDLVVHVNIEPTNLRYDVLSMEI